DGGASARPHATDESAHPPCGERDRRFGGVGTCLANRQSRYLVPAPTWWPAPLGDAIERRHKPPPPRHLGSNGVAAAGDEANRCKDHSPQRYDFRGRRSRAQNGSDGRCDSQRREVATSLSRLSSSTISQANRSRPATGCDGKVFRRCATATSPPMRRFSLL